MNRERTTRSLAVNRCPNCGTRVAHNAEKCYFCGYDLVNQPRRRRRITWVDALLVVAVLVMIGIWWRLGSQPEQASTDMAQIGLTIEIPTPVVPDTPTPVPSSTPIPTPMVVAAPRQVVHIVRSGETLLAIAGLYGVTVEEIQAANNLTGELIRVGDELIIPVSQAVSEGSADISVPSVFHYVVKPGDTVMSIAVRFGTTIEAILEANSLRADSVIHPGDRLLVPVGKVPSAVLASSDAVVESPDSRPADLGLYESPRLIGPTESERIDRTEDILFRWVSVDILATNEWYVLRVWPMAGGTQMPPTIWTKATSYRLSAGWAPASRAAATYAWQVTVVRVLPDVGAGREIQAASMPSEVRTFVWQ